MSNPISYILLSGGIDSTTALALACVQAPGIEVRCVSIDYGQRHRCELDAAATLAEKYDCEHIILKMPMGRTMLTDPDIEVPNLPYYEIRGVSPTYVPFRNGLMLSTLASHISARHHDPSIKGPDLDYWRDCLIYWGAHAEDAAGGAYPDCTAEFVGAMACAISIGTVGKIRLVAPFAAMSKAEVVLLGARLCVPYGLTWSCYRGGELHCGICPTCRARKEAFRIAGVDDLTEYAE